MRKLWLILILLTTAGLLMAAPLIEGFESTTAPPLGWYVVYANPYQTQGDFVAHSTDEHYEGDRSFRFSSIIGPTLPTYLITPRLEVTEGDQTISFYYYGYYDSFEEKFKVGWSSTGKEITDFTWSDEITHSSSSWEQYVKDDLPVGTKYVCIQYTSYRQAYFYFDKFVGPELYTGKPDSPVLFFPVNNTPTVALNALLYWYPSLEATSYLFFIGTDAEATNIVNGFDIGNVTSYSPELEYYDTTYYWTIAGVNSLGVSDKATIWSFTSRLHPIRPIPYMQDFNESVYWPSEWVSGGYKIYAGHGNGGNGVLKRLTGTKELDTIASFATCQIGPLAADSELKFDYRFMAYSNYPDDGFYPLAEGDMIEVQISTDDGQSYETIYTIDMNNHINSTQFATPTIPLFGYEGQIVRVKFTTSTPFGTSSDFYVDFDNINITGNATLPVELSAFNTAILANNTVSINWTTQSENNLMRYHILRSDDNQINNSICITNDILHATNSSIDADYNYIDQDVMLDNTYYYWLQSVEMNGTYEMYGPIVATVNQAGDNLPDLIFETAFNSIYPNPFNPNTTLSFSLAEKGDVNIKIFNVKGQLVKEINENALNKGMHNITWNGKDSHNLNCASGIYLFRLQVGKTVMMKKGMLVK